ncbi:hypothetical protein [Acinetobacter guillouiae]|nr:hypothetical protein [Acinetobacter guillouiae]MDO6646526.1 hypothetical protein [Acinetobacter guillouiae]
MSFSNPGTSKQHTSPILRMSHQETKSKSNKVSQAKRRKNKRQGRLL